MEYRRYYQQGGVYFFTVVTEQRQPLLIENIDRLRGAFCHCMDRYPFTIDGIVVLPDHLHTIWRLPKNDTDFSSRWMVIKRKFSAGLSSGKVNTSDVSSCISNQVSSRNFNIRRCCRWFGNI